MYNDWYSNMSKQKQPSIQHCDKDNHFKVINNNLNNIKISLQGFKLETENIKERQSMNELFLFFCILIIIIIIVMMCK